ncbi:MAG: hypothetical protein JNK47_16200 [Mesorhizobium sp.]|nr:hypothetical protein [Mesorhizobium sp.]MBL8578765.1 hypothetical protein [Mesorhizobium sp.]
MGFDEAMYKVARRLADVTDRMMKKHHNRVKHEDDLTGYLFGAIDERMTDMVADGIRWDASVLTHRTGGEEGKYGADILLHVSLDTPQQTYSKGVLIQAKRIGPNKNMRTKDHDDLIDQCEKMLQVSSASWVFAYDGKGMRAAPATKISGAAERNLYDQCDWTGYRFYRELFRCPVGDPKITTADVAALDVRFSVDIRGKGSLEKTGVIKG